MAAPVVCYWTRAAMGVCTHFRLKLQKKWTDRPTDGPTWQPIESLARV